MTSPDAIPTRGRSLRSTISSSGELRLELAERDVPEPAGSQVVVAVEASPINPSDLGVLLGAVAPGTLRSDGSDLVGAVPEAVVPLFRDRLDKPLPVGNEGAGTVIAAGPEAAALIGRRVALFGGSMWADYRVADAAAVVELPDDVSTAEGAALFINPLTALSMVETMRAEGHTALVHTAAASNLGQMLVRICAADGIGLVNIVRRAEHAQALRDLGAVHVVDSSRPGFAERLTEAIRDTGATLAFDAIGGGALAGDILTAMERAQPPPTSYTPYGTTVLKQVYIYGSLDFSPTIIDRKFGLAWSVGGYLLTNALARLGGEAIGRMRSRVLAEAKTTFASGYAQTIGLRDVLQPEILAVCAR
ncbi:MAG TPA: zinc-binding dehydrogenase, partial [Solirubrobacteraceae bacterium]|nr:zinc-binding dehydrogenase [Solirubrobacteraceae bacterium]